MSKTLLDDDNGSEIDFKINSSYAQKYETWRRKEELQKFKDQYGKDVMDNSEEESSSSSSEDESDEEIPEVFDKEFYHTLSCLKAKDPKIYDKNTKFFDKTDLPTKTEKNKDKKTKPMYLKDYERMIIVEKGGILSDEDEEAKNLIDERSEMNSPSYYEEQDAIKKDFKVVLKESDEEEEDKPFGGLFSVKVKSSTEKRQEEDEYAAWLQGRKEELKSEEEREGLSVLRSYWTDPSLDKGEAFLRDYILQKKFIPKGKEKSTKKSSSPIESDNESIHNDEEEMEKIEEFEHKFNFRFEEPDQEFIKRYPRTLDSTLRHKDDKRKQKREEVKKRKEMEMQHKKEELRKAKELKRKEIEARLQKLCSITGNTDIGFKGEDLDKDFDPQEHDRRMDELFSNNSFYATAEEEKPEFPVLDEELEIEDWDNWNGGEECTTEQNELHSEDPNFNMDCDYDPKSKFQREMILASQGKKAKKERGRNRRFGNSKLSKALAQKKPLFDPSNFISKAQSSNGSTSEAFEKYVDEYYGLDFEDVIGGDLPCRFKYRKVVPNSYGLSIEEILSAEDKELNRWCSLKKALRIKPEGCEKYDLHAYRKKGSNIRLKKKIFTSLYSDATEGVCETEIQLPKKKSKKAVESDFSPSNNLDSSEQCFDQNGLRNKKKKVEKVCKKDRDNSEEKKSLIGDNEENTQSDNGGINNASVLAKDSKKKNSKLSRVNATEGGISNGKHKKEKKATIQGKVIKSKKRIFSKDKYLSGLTKSRLKAYGINPKKFQNKLKYKNTDK